MKTNVFDGIDGYADNDSNDHEVWRLPAELQFAAPMLDACLTVWAWVGHASPCDDTGHWHRHWAADIYSCWLLFPAAQRLKHAAA